MLGAVITVPLILASGPLAGYLLARYVLIDFFGLPAFSIPILATLGFVASGLQIYRIIQKIRQTDSEQNQKTKK